MRSHLDISVKSSEQGLPGADRRTCGTLRGGDAAVALLRGAGLLLPARDDHHWRVYDEADEARVAEIRVLLDAGLPTSAIAQLIGCRVNDGDNPGRGGVDYHLRAELAEVRARLDARIRCLARNRDALDAWMRCPRPTDNAET